MDPVHREAILSQTEAITKSGGWRWDVSASTMTWTEGTYRIHDLDPSDFRPGDPVHILRSLECYRPEDRAAVLAAFQQCATEGVEYELEFPFRTAKVRDLWIKTAAKPIRQEGKVVGVIGNIVDITDRKRIEEYLRSEKERMRLYLDIADAIIVCLDASAAITMINRYGVRLLGFAEEGQLLGKNWFEVALPKPEGMEKVYPVFQRIMAGELEGTFYFENEILTSSGERRLIGWRNAFLRDSSGNPSGTLSVGLDMTEARASLKEKERLREALLESRRLESIGRLAGGVAHHFNNLLGVILGAADLAMMSDELDEDVKEQLEMISKAAKKAADLTRRMLTFARRQGSSPKIIDLNAAVDRIIPLLKTVSGQGVSVEWRPGKDVGAVSMDPLQLDQVLVELCTNARDAMKGIGTLIIGTGKEVKETGSASGAPDSRQETFAFISIADTGCGIEEGDIPKLFEPFYTTKPPGKAVGLGLSLVHGIVTQNRGFIEVESRPGDGVVFRIYLPAVATEGRFKSGEDGAIAGKGKRMVLVIGSDPLMLEMGKNMVERLGYKAMTAGSVAEAMELARQKDLNIDLVITDDWLPEMSGEELAGRIAALHPAIKILYAYSNPYDFDHFLEKPFSFSDLARKVNDIFRA